MKNILGAFLILMTGIIGMDEEDSLQKAIKSLEISDDLIKALYEDNIDAVHKELGKKRSIDFHHSSNGGPQRSPLSIAISRGHQDIVLALLDNGASPNFHYYTAPLIEAAKNGQWEIAHFLIERGANVNAMYGYTTPLITAIKYSRKPKCNDYEKTIEVLIQGGAQPTINLWYAIELMDAWACMRLLFLGADPEAHYQDGKTAFDLIKPEYTQQNIQLYSLLYAGSIARKMQNLFDICCSCKKRDKLD